ncbi:hypothetical protein GCM10027568_04690 [Humibacter soli]
MTPSRGPADENDSDKKGADENNADENSGSRPRKVGSPRWLINTIAIVAAVIIIGGIIATIALGGRLF